VVGGAEKGGAMNAVASSRQRVLDRICAATRSGAATAAQAAGSYALLSRDYVRRGALPAESRIELMLERLREYDAEVTECAPENLEAAIAAQLRASGRHSFVAPAGLPAEWRSLEFEWKMDRDGLPADEIEQAEGVVTACFCAVADSGTIVLHHSPAEGRRVLSLLPDWYLCILRASQIVETLPEYFSLCEQPPALVTWISGPSATADIEMTRVKGVHGPRFLHVILVRDVVADATSH
jgi:L-lactate dehydrogenase complex protein LldG